MKVSAKQASALATIALHAIPLALIGMHWQQARLHSAAMPGERVMEVRLQPASLSTPLLNAENEGMALLQESSMQLEGSARASPPSQGEASFVPPIQEEQAPLPPVYLTGAELDVRPQPEKPLSIPFPDKRLEQSLVTGVLVLYIGLDGKVENIEIMDSTLPPEFERVAKETFMGARMLPGMKDGKRVRSQMKVLVEFESRGAF